MVDLNPDDKGSEELARGGIPELGGPVRACCQDPSAVQTKDPLQDATLMGKGGEELARSRVPELGTFVSACRQDAGTVGTKRHILDSILMGKGSDRQGQRLFTMDDQFLEESF